MSNTLSQTAIDNGIMQQPYFHVVNTDGLNWEGFATSKEELEARFPTATVTEWQPTEFAGIWEL